VNRGSTPPVVSDQSVPLFVSVLWRLPRCASCVKRRGHSSVSGTRRRTNSCFGALDVGTWRWHHGRRTNVNRQVTAAKRVERIAVSGFRSSASLLGRPLGYSEKRVGSPVATAVALQRISDALETRTPTSAASDAVRSSRTPACGRHRRNHISQDAFQPADPSPLIGRTAPGSQSSCSTM
jgi:hypothetical protein